MQKFYLHNQISILDKNDHVYLYNWYNDKGVSIEKNFIKQICGHEIIFEDSFSQNNIAFLTQEEFFADLDTLDENINTKLQNIIDIEQQKLRLILLPAGYLCNFRCKYCYEYHNSKRIYNDADAKAISIFIDKYQHKNITIEYFGGEPLLNLKWILNFQNKNKDKILTSSITTNGYLLSKDVFSKLLALKCFFYQVTIDGLEDDHNFLRPTISGHKTWQRIINNIIDIQKINKYFYFIIRINFNANTTTDGKIKKIFQNFNFILGDSRFRLLFKPIDAYSDLNNTTTDEILSVTCSKDSRNILKQLQTEAQNAGFLLADVSLIARRAGLICYASNKNTFVVDCDRKTLKCTISVNQDYNIFGHIEDDGTYTDYKKDIVWGLNNIQISEQCKQCFLLYQCLSANCPSKKYIKGVNSCPHYVFDEQFSVNMILRQKEILKELIHGNKNN